MFKTFTKNPSNTFASHLSDVAADVILVSPAKGMQRLHDLTVHQSSIQVVEKDFHAHRNRMGAKENHAGNVVGHDAARDIHAADQLELMSGQFGQYCEKKGNLIIETNNSVAVINRR